jgi:hypothetical protein
VLRPRPIRAGQPRSERVFQPAVESLHQPVGLRVACCGETHLHAKLAQQGVPNGRAELPTLVRGDLLRDAESGHPAGHQGVRAAGRHRRPKRNSLGPAGRPIDDREEVGVAVLRHGEGAYQVDVQVAEALGGVGDVSRRRRRLGRYLSSLAALTISAPGSDLGRQAWPYETAGNQPPGRPDARVRQAVHGVEDGTAKNLWNDGSEDP